MFWRHRYGSVASGLALAFLNVFLLIVAAGMFALLAELIMRW